MTTSDAGAGYFRSGLPYNRLGHGPRIVVVFQGLMFANKPLDGPLASGITDIHRFLGEDYTVYLVGRRPGLPAGFTLEDMADDYATMIRQEFGGPVDVIGLSTGGSIAQHFAAEYPDLVRRLVLHSTAYRLGEPGRRVQRDVAQLARQGQWREASATLLRGVYAGQWYSGIAVAFVSHLMAHDAPKDPSDLIITIEAEDRFDCRDRLGKITAPTLVIASDQDPFYPTALFRETAAGIPNAQFVLLPPMGHPAKGPELERVVRAFLATGEVVQPAPAHAEAPDSEDWRRAYRIGGVAALTTAFLAMLDVVLSFLPSEQEIQPGRLSATDWFARIRRSRFFALRDLGLWNLINAALGMLLYLALYGAHRRASRGTAALAALLATAGAVVYAVNNRALRLLALSKRYTAAGSPAERAKLAAAGERMLARGADFTPGSFPGFFLTELAGIVMGIAMLRSRVFAWPVAWSGIAGSGLLLVFTVVATFVPAAHRRATVLAMGGGLLSIAWQVLTARQLFRLSK